MKKYIFEPKYSKQGKLSSYSQDQIKNEPMLFSADYDFAMKNGGAITKEFLSKLNKQWKWVIDSRVHMLMPGWYPCIPGWHHDDIPRTREDKQPNYEKMEYHSDHVMTVVGDCSLTEFAKTSVMVKPVSIGKIVYKEWNNNINNQIKKGIIEVEQINEGDVISFDAFDFHRGMPATKNGWRFFIRASRNTTRPVLNEMRTQVQVYMSELEAGW